MKVLATVLVSGLMTMALLVVGCMAGHGPTLGVVPAAGYYPQPQTATLEGGTIDVQQTQEAAPEHAL